MLKRIFSLALAVLMVLGALSACGNTEQPQNSGTEPTPTETVKNDGTLKVLTLGHSLAVDAGHMLALVAAAEGYEELTVGTLYYSGCPLNLHVEHLKNDSRAYSLYYSSTADVSAPPTIMENVTMLEAIRYQDWDIILMQGGVFEIAKSTTYTNGDIQTIRDYVNQNKLNPNAVFGWNMAWAPPVDDDLRNTYTYEPNSYINNYIPYNHDRTAMYNDIAKCVSDHIMTDDTFTCMIPSGTVMENALSSYLTEKDLHRDYVHATDLARLMISYTWFCVLTGVEQLEDIKLTTIPKAFFRSTVGGEDRVLTDMEKAIVLESVNNALKNPLTITQSQFTVAPAA